MAKYIHLGSTFESELRRIIDERTDKALSELNQSDNPDAAVHQARKEFKKIRAAWRLIRDDLGQDGYKEKNVFYRDLGREISDLRDSKAVVESLDLLQDRYGEVLYESAFEQAAEALRRRQQAAFGGDKVELIRRVGAQLVDRRETINAFQLSMDLPENVVSSVQRVYGRGYERFQESKKEPDTAVLHTWRKRAKYLRYHFHILRAAWPPVFEVMEDELHELTDLLGDYHDLAMLKEEMNTLGDDLGEATREAFSVLATQQQIDLYERALVLGGKLYADKPGTFARRMEVWLAEMWE